MHRGANSNDQLWHRANKHDNLYSATRVIHWRPAEQTRSGNAKYSAALCPPPPPHAPLPPRLAERSGPMLWGPAPVRCAKLEGSARQLLEGLPPTLNGTSQELHPEPRRRGRHSQAPAHDASLAHGRRASSCPLGRDEKGLPALPAGPDLRRRRRSGAALLALSRHARSPPPGRPVSVLPGAHVRVAAQILLPSGVAWAPLVDLLS
ncbi:unnamed protein product, partial [Prorocentrum cordatum]